MLRVEYLQHARHHPLILFTCRRMVELPSQSQLLGIFLLGGHCDTSVPPERVCTGFEDFLSCQCASSCSSGSWQVSDFARSRDNGDDQMRMVEDEDL
jgi:hypothetical protein